MWCLVCGVRCVVCGMVCGVCCVVWCVVCGVTLHFHKSHGISAHYIDLGFENQAVTVSEFVWEGSIQHNAGVGCLLFFPGSWMPHVLIL